MSRSLEFISAFFKAQQVINTRGGIHCTKMGADKSAENTQKLSVHKPKSLVFRWKKGSLGVRSPCSKTFEFFDNIAVLKNVPIKWWKNATFWEWLTCTYKRVHDHSLIFLLLVWLQRTHTSSFMGDLLVFGLRQKGQTR